MLKLIKKIYANDIIRYVFFGALTTLVNLVSYYILRRIFYVNMNVANVISIIAAILFAYVVNSRFVFHSKARGLSKRFREFIKFISARISTMVIEVGGVWFMAEIIHMDDMLGKILIQFIVLVLNYIFSKFLVFKKQK